MLLSDRSAGMALVVLLLIAVSLPGCDEELPFVPLAVCTPVLDALAPESGGVEGGTSVTLSGLFVATELGERDTQVFLAGRQAEITGVFRGAGCDPCDACILVSLRCAECERVCRGLSGWEDPSTGSTSEAAVCEEWVSFTTPEVPAPIETEVLLVNSRGSERGLSFAYVLDGDDDDSGGDDDDSAGGELPGDDDSAP